ncbi:MAG: hypothetical protein M1820_001113 [Bogoriella megaspora]|nr:MAG: hypothetical protein M1820_001113 [Bogoriella megaspora]
MSASNQTGEFSFSLRQKNDADPDLAFPDHNKTGKPIDTDANIPIRPPETYVNPWRPGSNPETVGQHPTVHIEPETVDPSMLTVNEDPAIVLRRWLNKYKDLLFPLTREWVLLRSLLAPERLTEWEKENMFFLGECPDIHYPAPRYQRQIRKRHDAESKGRPPPPRNVADVLGNYESDTRILKAITFLKQLHAMLGKVVSDAHSLRLTMEGKDSVNDVNKSSAGTTAGHRGS